MVLPLPYVPVPFKERVFDCGTNVFDYMQFKQMVNEGGVNRLQAGRVWMQFVPYAEEALSELHGLPVTRRSRHVYFQVLFNEPANQAVLRMCSNPRGQFPAYAQAQVQLDRTGHFLVQVLSKSCAASLIP